MSRESAGAAIRALRESRDWSLADLAAATGVSTMGLSYLERGARKPHKSTVQKVENGLGLPPGTYSRLLVAADPDAELARLIAAQPSNPTAVRRAGAVVVDRHSDTDVLEGYAEAQLDAIKSVIDRLPATTSNEYETYILSVIAQCVKAEMLAASSWRVAVNAGADSTGRLMEHLRALEATRGALLERMPTSLSARFDRACAQSSLPEAVVAALIGVGADEMWDIRNRGVIPAGALPASEPSSTQSRQVTTRMRGSSELQRGRAVESRSSTVRRRQSATGVGCGHHTYGDLLSRAADLNVGAGQRRYQLAVDHSRAALLSAARTDAAAGAVITGAQRDRAWARRSTGTVLDEARSDTTVTAVMPIAQREAIRRRVARLRAQRAHVLTARRRARRHLAALRALRYRVAHGPGSRWPNFGCRRRAVAPASRSTPRCRDLAVPMSGAQRGPTSSTVPVWSSGPTPRRVFTWIAPPINRSTRGSRCRAHRSGRAIWSSRTPGTCSWRSATIWSSRRPMRARRFGSARWATTCRFGDR